MPPGLAKKPDLALGLAADIQTLADSAEIIRAFERRVTALEEQSRDFLDRIERLEETPSGIDEMLRRLGRQRIQRRRMSRRRKAKR